MLDVTDNAKIAKANAAAAIASHRIDAKLAAHGLARGGYVPVMLMPVTIKQDGAGKVPASFERGEWSRPNDWPTKAKGTSLEEFAAMIELSASVPNIGILCGEPIARDRQHLGYLAGVDIDCDAPDLVAALAKKFGSKFACRKGRVDRSGCIPILVAIDSLDGMPEVYHRKGSSEDKIQVLKQGKQFVAFGAHPSGVMYQWRDADTKIRNIPSSRSLPVVTFSDLESIFSKHGFVRGAGKIGTKLDSKTKSVEAQRLSALQASGDMLSFDDLTEGDGAPYDGDAIRTIADDVETTFEDEETNADGNQSRNSARQSFINRLRARFSNMGIDNGFSVCVHFDNVCGEYVATGKTTGQYTASQFVKDWNNASQENRELYDAVVQEKAITRTEQFGQVSSDDDDGYGSDEPSADRQALIDKHKEVKVIEAEVIDSNDSDDVKVSKKQKQLDRLHKLFECLSDIPDVENDSVEWGIKHVTALCTTSIMIGMWGAGKSAIALDMGFAQSIGQPWGGKKTVHGVVVYVALENHGDIKRRLRAMRRCAIDAGKDISRCAFVVWKASIDLFDSKGEATRGETDLIEVAKLNSERFNLPIVQIVVDTVAKSRGAAKENEATDAGLYIKSLERIANATNANVMALHHPARNTEHARGSGALEADCDTLLNVSKATNGICTLKASEIKFRVGDPARARFSYRLKSEMTGTDEDGDPITVVLADSVEPVTSRPVGQKHPADDDGGLIQELPNVTPGDKIADRERQIVDHVFRAEAERTKPDDVSSASTLDALRLGVGEIVKLLNAWRVKHNLSSLARSSVQDVVFKMRDKRVLCADGAKGRPDYSLVKRSGLQPKNIATDNDEVAL